MSIKASSDILLFLRYSAFKGTSLKSRLGIMQGCWKWYRRDGGHDVL